MRYLCLLLTMVATPAFAADCGPRLEPVTFASIAARRAELKAKKEIWTFSGKFLWDFHQTGWRHMQSVADDSGVAVVDLLDDALQILDLHWAELKARIFPDAFTTITPAMLRQNIAPLADVPLDPGELEDAEGMAIIRAAMVLRALAMQMVLAQKVLKHAPNLDPHGPMDVAWMSAFIDNLQLISLDYAVGMSEIIDHMYADLGTARPYVPPAAPTTAPEPTYADLVRQPAPAFVADREYPVDLVARSDRRRVRVTFAADLIKDLNGAQSAQAVRLLRAVVAPQTARSGVKALTSLGSNIVEIKAIMRGHWRIIGCLEDDRLRLLSLMDLPESVAAYAKRINKNLCAEP